MKKQYAETSEKQMHPSCKKMKKYLSARRGRKTELAKELGVSQSYISHLINGYRPVPVEHCAAIEIATKGAISRRDLRPDDWARIWPEMVKNVGGKNA